MQKLSDGNAAVSAAAVDERVELVAAQENNLSTQSVEEAFTYAAEPRQRRNSQADALAIGRAANGDPFQELSVDSEKQGLERPRAKVEGSGEVTIGQEKHSFGFQLKQLGENAWSLAVDAANAAVEVPAAIGAVVSTFIRKPQVAVAGAAIGAGAASMPQSALAIAGNQTDAAYINLGKNYSSRVVPVFTSYQGISGTSSGVIVNDEYVITDGHVAYSPPGTVGFNVSVYGDPAVTVTTIPGFDYSFTEPDISALKLQFKLSTISAPTPLDTTPISITGSSIGESLTMAGFGRNNSGGQDDILRAATIYVSSYVHSDVSDVYYNEGQYPDGSQLTGMGQPGDSGGGVFDSSGNLVGLIKGGFGSPADGGDTDYLDLGQSDVGGWLSENTIPMPEPGSFVIIGLVSGVYLIRRRS